MKQTPLKDYKCDNLLLNFDTIKRLTSEYENWHEPKSIQSKYGELALSTFISWLFNLLAAITAWANLDVVFKTIAVAVLVLLFFYCVYAVFKWVDASQKIKGKPALNLDEMLLNSAKETMRYTGIIRIVYKEKGKLIYLTGSDYFLPHCNLNIKASIAQQDAEIKQCLYEFDILESEIIRIEPVDNKIHHSIKPIHGTIQMNAFVFYDAYIKIQAKNKLTQFSSKRKWVSIEEMRKSAQAISTNKDVIDLLDSFSVPAESFENLLGNFKIIWNITAKCPYNCAICATHDDNRKELCAADKLKVLNSICTAKDLIESLDFAGGDPLHFDESTNIIQSAIQQLGSDKVAVTTTGKGISDSSEDVFLGVVKHCELTIDAAHANLSNLTTPSGFISRHESNYSDDNIEKIHLISQHAQSLTINIPIINDDLSDTEIDTLVKKVLWIRDHTTGLDLDVSLIRLMPVGKMKEIIKKDEYLKYNPIPVAQKIKARFENNSVPCKLHCSLRVLPSMGGNTSHEYCTMLENKLGIDCAGNVFACAWGGYVANDNIPTQNPFYLGNLTKRRLIDIIKGDSRTHAYMRIFTEIENRNLRNYCSVVSYYAKKDMFKNSDPLA